MICQEYCYKHFKMRKLIFSIWYILWPRYLFWLFVLLSFLRSFTIRMQSIHNQPKPYDMGLPQTCIDDTFQCISYLMVMPFIMFSGLIGSIATFFILNGSKFRNNTFFYLKALSLSDMMYLVLTFGYIYEIMFLESYASMTSVAKVFFWLSKIVEKIITFRLTWPHLMR